MCIICLQEFVIYGNILDRLPSEISNDSFRLFNTSIVLGESVDAVQFFSLFALDVIMRAAFGVETDLQRNPDPEFVARARRVFQTPLWVRFFSMFPFWAYFSR